MGSELFEGALGLQRGFDPTNGIRNNRIRYARGMRIALALILLTACGDARKEPSKAPASASLENIGSEWTLRGPQRVSARRALFGAKPAE